MNRTRKARAITVVALAAAISAVPPAVAGTDNHLGTAGGVSYLSDTETMLAGTPATSDVSCPAGKGPTGGGFEVIPAPGYSVYQTLPWNLDTASPGFDGWRTVAIEDNPPGNASILPTYVICRAEASRYVKAGGRLPAGTPGARTLTARCPSGMHVTGGGAAAGSTGTPGDAYVNSTYPIDTGDADSEPDDGWRARLYGTEQPGTRVIAICADEMPFYDTRTFEVEGGSNTGAIVDCRPSKHVVGVGVRIDGNAAQGRAVSAGFSDGFALHENDDADDVPDDVATGSGFNESGPPKNVTVFAVCG